MIAVWPAVVEAEKAAVRELFERVVRGTPKSTT